MDLVICTKSDQGLERSAVSCERARQGGQVGRGHARLSSGQHRQLLGNNTMVNT